MCWIDLVASNCDLFNSYIKQVLSVQEQCVIVATRASVLDALEKICNRLQCTFCRLDGRMSVKRCDEAVQAFRTSNIPVFLLSKLAGACGLNLTAATRLLLYDVDFNPAVDVSRSCLLGGRFDLVSLLTIPYKPCYHHLTNPTY